MKHQSVVPILLHAAIYNICMGRTYHVAKLIHAYLLNIAFHKQRLGIQLLEKR
jgi:hypothetical protein